jgi:hypothetical protein
VRTLFIHLQRRRALRRTKLVSRATGSGRLRVAPPAAPPWLVERGPAPVVSCGVVADRWSAGERSELPGHRCNACQILQLT